MRTPAARRRAIRVGVQSRAQHHDLPHPALQGSAQRVFRESGAHRDEHAHAPPRGIFVRLASHGFGVLAQNAQRQRIAENTAAIQNLVRGAMPGRRPGCPAGPSCLHWSKLTQDEFQRACTRIADLSGHQRKCPRTGSDAEPGQAGRQARSGPQWHPEKAGRDLAHMPSVTRVSAPPSGQPSSPAVPGSTMPAVPRRLQPAR